MRAFGDSQITEQRIGKALAQFVDASCPTGPDMTRGEPAPSRAQDDFDNFTLKENRGKALFMRSGVAERSVARR